MQLIKRLFAKMKQFIQFGFVGAVNTVLNYLIYLALVSFLAADPVVANGIGYFVTSVIAFFLNKQWVFKKDSQAIHKTLLKFYVTYGSSLIITMLLSALFAHVILVHEYLIPALCLCVTVPYNFLLSKLWVFRSGSEDGTKK